MRLPPYGRVFIILGLLACSIGSVSAQRGASGPVAELNAEARLLSDSDPDRSLALAQQALAAARGSRDLRGQAEAFNYIAYAYRAHSLLDVARQNALESIRLYAQSGDRVGEAQGYNTLGLIEADAGRFPDALEAHLEALHIREAAGDKEGLAYSYNNLGNAYRNMAQYDKALEYHERGLALKIEIGNRSSEAFSHHNIGLVHAAMGNNARALAAYERAIAIRAELNDRRQMAVTLNAIGRIEAQTTPAAALRTYERALVLRREVGDTRGEMATELSIGDIYRQMKDPARARAAYNRAIALGDSIDAPLMRSNALRGLAEVEAARGDYAAAYQHIIQHQEAREKMFNDQSAARLQRLSVAHETERQQQQIQALQHQGEMREAELARVRAVRTALASIAVLVLVSLGLLYARYRLKRQSEARLLAQAEALADALARVQTLRGLLPICAWCKKIRDDNGYWTQVEAYVSSHSQAEFTHSICPSCSDEVRVEELETAAARGSG
jgi:tetratricopeptide (TPR) repeat protein